MAKASSTQVYEMKLADFNRYLGDKSNEMAACAAKVRAIQNRFTAIFTTELMAWQAVFAYCIAEVGTRRAELPPAFASVIDQAEQEERERLTREIADLDSEVDDKRERMDALLGESQETTKRLRQSNPSANQREEDLKLMVVRYQDEFASAYEAIEALQSGLLGEISNWRKIHRLRKVQRTAKKQQADVMKRLRDVRQSWLTKVEKAGDVQSQLRAEWQELGVRVAQAEGRREHLAGRFDDLALEAALTRVLQELNEPPDVPGELGAKLAELVTRNDIRTAYEAGLEAAAEAIGMADGLAKGLGRFHDSVKRVVAQQRQYNLKAVTIALPRATAVLNETWRIFTDKIDNDDYYAKHPREFVQLEIQFIRKPLTDENIKALFETMGNALNRGTAVWK